MKADHGPPLVTRRHLHLRQTKHRRLQYEYDRHQHHDHLRCLLLHPLLESKHQTLSINTAQRLRRRHPRLENMPF